MELATTIPTHRHDSHSGYLITTWFGALLDVLHPPSCAACRDLIAPADSPGNSSTPETLLPLCETCAVTLERVAEPCDLCGEPDSPGGICRHCAASPPPFESIVALWHYGAAIADVLQRFKYEDQPALAKPLGRLLADARLPRFDVVTPVPLHWRRRLVRGYDQALLLASELARNTGLPFERALLIRSRSTRRQVGASRKARDHNVAGAFIPGKALDRWKGARVLLVDDVVTTGATAAACAWTLLRHGAREVHVASIARAG